MGGIKKEFYGDSVDIRLTTNGDLGGNKVYTNGDLRYTVIGEVKISWKSQFLKEKYIMKYSNGKKNVVINMLY